MWKKIDSPSAEGSPVVTRYNYATGQYMRPSQYGDNMRTQNLHGLDVQPDTWNSRMGVKGNSPMRNYMVGNGNSPMDRGGANMFPSPIQGYQYLTTGGYPPPSAMPQNANIYPAMYNHQTGQRIDPQSNNGLIVPVFKDKHFNQDNEVGEAMFSGLPEYLKPSKPDMGSTIAFRDVSGKGGYKYRQFADGSIQIMQSPYGTTGKAVPKGSGEWQAITDEIGAYPSSSASVQTGNQRGNALIAQGQQFAQSEQGQNVLSAFFDRIVSTQTTKSEQQRLATQQAQLEQQKIAQRMRRRRALPYIGAAVGIGVVATAIWFATQPKGKK